MKTIADIDRLDRPREKLAARGPRALEDYELVAAILGRGVAGRDVLLIAREVAALIRDHREALTLDHLAAVGGMGAAKAAQILAGFELARRHLLRETVAVSGPADLLPLLSDIASRRQEHFVCITLNGAHEVIQKRIITVGLLNETQIHPREVFADALTDRAAAVVFAHNHSSGQLQPSTDDLRTQAALEQAAEILGIRVLDHLIVSTKGFFSFQEHNLLGKGY